MERNEIMSPFIRIEVPLGDPIATPRLVRLDDVRRLGVWTVNRTRATAEIMEQAAVPLLEAICAGKLPPAADAARLRASYREWISVHGVLSDEMRRVAPAFFTWVEGDD